MKKLVIISFDLLLALPILTISFMLLFSSIKGSQGYLSALGGSQDLQINAFVTSQQLASALDSSSQNYSAAALIAAGFSKSYNATSALVGITSASACEAARTICRLVTVSGNAYLLVLSYENSN